MVTISCGTFCGPRPWLPPQKKCGPRQKYMLITKLGAYIRQRQISNHTKVKLDKLSSFTFVWLLICLCLM